jgi:RND family efflux transporter MFP subunit
VQAKSARIQYEQAKLNYDYQMEFSNITASIGGTVEQCDVEVHDNVAQQSLICVISGEGSKAITFSVTEKVVDQMQVGDRVTIEKNGKEYQGSVTEISSMIDASSGLFKIKASVENGDALPTGSAVSLFVVSDRADQAMSIPVDAVYYTGGDAYVYTYDNGTVHHIPVEVGIYDSERAEILSGIQSDDLVITTWSSELAEGAKVQLSGEVQTGGGQAEPAEEDNEQAGNMQTENAQAE